MLDRPEQDHWAFSLLELCLLLMVIGLLVALLLPSFRGRDGSPLRLRDVTQARDIHPPLAALPRDDSGHSPGLLAEGGASKTGAYPGVRYVILLDADDFTGKVAPSSADPGVGEWTTTGVPVSNDHFSLSLLAMDLNMDGRIDRRELLGAAGRSRDRAAGQGGVWDGTLNIDRPPTCSRTAGVDAADRPPTLHDDPEPDPGDRRRSAACNENGVAFESVGRDAAMVHEDARTLAGRD